MMLKDIVRELEKGKFCVLLHVNADPDALGSAFALNLAFTDVHICAIEGLSKNSKFLQNNLDITVEENPDLSRYERVVIVDTASPERLGELKGTLSDPIVIDHHPKSSKWKTNMYYTDESRSSCAEIVYQILNLAYKKITREIGLSLCAGILTDSGKFSYADSETLRIFAQIMDEAEINMEDVLALFSQEHETDYSKRISRLKGAQRLKFEGINGFVVAQSQVGSFESSVCSALLSLGADCAFVGSQREDDFRISARATHSLVLLGLHLGNLLEDVGSELNCDGGGHDGAAGLSGVGDVEAILNICLKVAKSQIKGLARSP